MSAIAGIIAGGAALAGTATSAIAQGKLNRRAERFNRWMWDQQGERELAYWNMQNEYNLPQNQMARLQEAGLNPHLFYGSGSQSVQAAPLSSKSGPSSPNFTAPRFDLGSVVQQAMSTKAMEAQISRTEAETQRIQQTTLEGQFDLSVKQRVGVDRLSRELDNKVALSNTRTAKEVREFDEWMQVAFDDMSGASEIVTDQFGSYVAGSNSLIRQATKAGLQQTVQNLQNAKKAGVLRDDQHALNQIEKEIRDFTRRLSDVGISPQSTQALQVIVSMLKTIFGK